ncbi:MAG TPA: phytase [Oligoflexus sp.]|uniref:phytase n=1 Tax=Oligoflexus sp. TaxID=1971216 RepID=UPI002D80D081|nr:phytase [Oligoflexus sp.]HET9239683.1 phytase [Oligoflexus sp.]
MRFIFGIACLVPMTLAAQVPVLDATTETAPIPAGFSDSDDAAVWAHPRDPKKSIILGTSKYDEGGQGGLGVYALDGQELQFFSGSKLNSVDILNNLAVATNRSDNALDLYRIQDGRVSFLKRAYLLDAQGQSFEPYGLCLAPGDDESVRIYLPTKTGVLYEYSLNKKKKLALKNTYDLAAVVTPEQDARMQSVVTKETIAEGEEEELEENLAERFILEGCVHDPRSGMLYIGMENLGIWRLKAKALELVIPVQGSWTDLDSWAKPGVPRVTDDIEGMDIVSHKGRSYLLFSSQGLSEFTLYDLDRLNWMGNFKIRLNAKDPVSLTDGLAIQGGNLGPRYPKGVLVVHDDENTDKDGNTQPANYKIVSLKKLWDIFAGGPAHDMGK